MRKGDYFIFFILQLLLIVILGSASYPSPLRVEDKELELYRKVSKYVDENEKCFRCHGKTDNLFKKSENSPDSLNLKEKQIISREEFYRSNHRSLSCIGCHADPTPENPGRTSKEIAASKTCTDCHQYIKNHQDYQFITIEEEYLQSIHHLKKQSEFGCWKCHNPHIYKINFRNAENYSAAITYDNNTCLSCHPVADKLAVLFDEDTTKQLNRHSWLPDTEKHFRSVRCIDCHTKIDKNVLIPHMILSKEHAVKRCSECHSPNSLLLATLYKCQAIEVKNPYGLFNVVVVKDVLITGGNRIEILNKISMTIYVLTLTGIFIHIMLRIMKKKKN